MKIRLLLLALVLSTLLAWSQHAGYNPPVIDQHSQSGKPTGPSEFDVAKTQGQNNPYSALLPGTDLDKLKQDADELAFLAQSIPPDVSKTTKGILPQDLSPKLKKIEKLAKQLRAQIIH
ncbi:MAG: hypothetical protein ABSG34_06300 [Candidatus Sulfotelmatobacter sp.]